jgi:hypothetical protein
LVTLVTAETISIFNENDQFNLQVQCPQVQCPRKPLVDFSSSNRYVLIGLPLQKEGAIDISGTFLILEPAI